MQSKFLNIFLAMFLEIQKKNYHYLFLNIVLYLMKSSDDPIQEINQKST